MNLTFYLLFSFFSKDINMYLQLLLLIHIDKAQVDEILPHIRQ